MTGRRRRYKPQFAEMVETAKGPRPNRDRYFGQEVGKPKHKPNADSVSEYALAKARKLTAAQFEQAGLPQHAKEYGATFLTNPLIAFAAYIDRME